MPKLNEAVLLTRATRAYFQRFGAGAAQPNRARSRVEGDQVILENVNGELARYRLSSRGLSFVPVAS